MGGVSMKAVLAEAVIVLRSALVVGAIEVLITEKVLGAPGAGLDEILAGAGELKIMLPDIPQDAFGVKSRGFRLGRANREGALEAVERTRRADVGIKAGSDVLSGAE